MLYYISNDTKKIATSMLAPLMTHNSSATDVQMEDKADIKCPLKYLILEE